MRSEFATVGEKSKKMGDGKTTDNYSFFLTFFFFFLRMRTCDFRFFVVSCFK